MVVGNKELLKPSKPFPYVPAEIIHAQIKIPQLIALIEDVLDATGEIILRNVQNHQAVANCRKTGLNPAAYAILR